ncbi:MAG: type II toxin-antitoxin system YafQ family toxin [Nitrospirota bacterium]
MLQPFYTKQFRKDLKRIEKSGSHDIEKLKVVIRLLTNGKELAPKHKNHFLTGNFKNRRECHVEPDWLLVYKIDKREKTIIFERTGIHADIF